MDVKRERKPYGIVVVLYSQDITKFQNIWLQELTPQGGHQQRDGNRDRQIDRCKEWNWNVYIEPVG